MKDNAFIKKRKFDLITCILFFIVICFSLLFDVSSNIPIFNIFTIKFRPIESLMNTLFSVQATVATLGIVLISLMSGTLKDTVFGIAITEYLMQIKPLIFKHKTIILTQLSLILIGYGFLSFRLYNSLVALFFISISMVSLMTCDIFTAFLGQYHIEKEVYDYILEVFSNNRYQKNNNRQNIINGIKNEILHAIYDHDTICLKKDFNLLIDVFYTIKKDSNIMDKTEISDIYQSTLSDIFITIFKNNNSENIVISLNAMSSIYKKCNELNSDRNYTFLKIWDRIAKEYFEAITYLNPKQLFHDGIIAELHDALYDNLYFEIIDGRSIQQNNNYLDVYSTRIYYDLLKQPIQTCKNEEISYFKKDLYDFLFSNISYKKYKYYSVDKQMALFSELYNYTRVLIDNSENEILEKTIFLSLDYANSELQEKKDYYLIIICYLYYLSEESLVSPKLENSVEDLIEHVKSTIGEFLIMVDPFAMGKSFVEKANNTLRFWEIMPKEQAKLLLIGNIIEKFVIFNILHKNWTIDLLIKDIQGIIEHKEFSAYDTFAGSKKEATRKDYKSFVKLFFTEIITEQESQEKVDMLESAIAIIYKDSELTEKKKSRFSINYDEITIKMKEYSLPKLKETISHFSNKPKEILQIQIPLLNLITENSFLTDSEIEGRIFDLINTYFVRSIINLTYQHLKMKDVKFDDKSMLDALFNAIESVGFIPNTIIGYRNWFFGESKAEDFKQFEKDKIKIQSNGCKNVIITIQSERFYFNIKQLNIKITKLSLDECSEKIKQDEVGNYQYNVTNDIYLPFKKNELIQYLADSKCRILVDADVEYGFSDEIIGAGIFINK